MRITFDNSAADPRNPSRFPARVHTGPRSEDEMGQVWLQALPEHASRAAQRPHGAALDKK